MKKIMVVLLALVLAGCATQMREAERKRQWDAVNAELSRQTQAAESGAQTWAQTYKNMSDYGYRSESPIYRQALTSGAAVIMPYARMRDARQISAEQFSDIQMMIGAKLTQWIEQQNQIDEDRFLQRQAAESAALNQALGSLYLSQQIANPQRFQPTINCTTNQVGSFTNTSCR